MTLCLLWLAGLALVGVLICHSIDTLISPRR